MLFGPGKADLLEHIAATGSISAAGRAMGMSYKRAWMLVEALNAGFASPLVESARGGPGGGGAALTAMGEEVLQRYRNLTAVMAADPTGDLAKLMQLMSPAEKPKAAEVETPDQSSV